MSRRLLLRAFLLLLVVLAGALAVPGVRWPLWGWLRGEAFYQGKPTSYWRAEVENWLAPVGAPQRPAWLERLFPSPDQRRGPEPFGEPDPRAVPVLLALLEDNDATVRIHAAGALEKGLGGEATVRMALAGEPGGCAALVKALGDDEGHVRRAAVIVLAATDRLPEVSTPVLISLLEDPDPNVRLRAAWALGQAGPTAEAAVPALCRGLRDDYVGVRENCARALGEMRSTARPAAGALAEAVNDPSPAVRSLAAEALQGVDQQAAAEAGAP